jgi:hypothetical protein
MTVAPFSFYTFLVLDDAFTLTSSLSTLASNDVTDMNIATYVTPVGIRPARKWIISLYKNTLSYENFANRRSGVLQLLDEAHDGLIFTLGGQVSL